MQDIYFFYICNRMVSAIRLFHMKHPIFIVLLLVGHLCWSQDFRTYEQMSATMSKQDMERQFEADLSEKVFSYKPSSQWAPTGAVRLSSDVWIVSKGKYGEDTCRNAAFFRKADDGTMTPLFDSEMAEETVRTLCSIDCGRNIMVDLSFNRYGYKVDHAQCPIGALIDFCLGTGCVPYVQFDSIGDEMIIATLLMVNAEAGYNHVFKVEVPTSLLTGGKANVAMTLNAFVPTHNLKDLHADK